MSDPNYARREPLPLFAINDPPRRTARQETRWSTQDEAWQNALQGSGTAAARIIAALKAQPDTCDAIEDRLGMTHQTASATINGLMRRGVIVAEGSALTRSGRRARKWRMANAE